MMSVKTKRSVVWFTLAGLAGLGSVGCTAQTKEPPVKPTAAMNPQSVDLNAGVRPSTLNIFGEFDGQKRGNVRLASDENFEQHTFVDEGYDTDVAVSPNGKVIVFASTRNSEHPGLYLQKVDGTAVVQLTGEDCDNAYPAFSPDGKTIAFCSTRSGVWQIYTMDIDGRSVVQVTNTQMQCVHPSFSPDGTRIVYSALGGRSGQWELWVADLNSGTKRSIGVGLFPSWSTDKTVDRIAFQKPRQRGGRWFSLWTLDLIDGEARHLTEIAASTNAAVISPAWSPDGKRIAFSTIANPNREAGASQQQDVWTIAADGTDRRRLTDGTGVNLSPAWASDDRIYFVSDRNGSECIWSAKADAAQDAVASRSAATGGSAVANAASETKANTPAQLPGQSPTQSQAKTDPFATAPTQDASMAGGLQDATR